MRIKFNDKIYRLKEIESGVDSLMELVEEYKDGDFVVSEFGSILILKEADGDRIFDHAYLPSDGELIINKVASYEGVKRHATTEEKQRMIEALAERGKRWNKDKKCIENVPVYKKGDILVKEYTENKKFIFILSRIDDDGLMYCDCYCSTLFNRTKVVYDILVGNIWNKFLRRAVESEKKLLISELLKIGKQWNDDKKCVEDIPKRKFKAGDKVRIKDGVSSKTHGGVYPYFEGFLDQYIGKVMTVKEYVTTCLGEYIRMDEAKRGDRYFGFAEDWLGLYVEKQQRKFKAGDKVKIKDGISSKTHRSINPCFTSTMDEFIGKELTVEKYSSGGFVVFFGCYLEYEFAEDWLEPWSDEPKVGDWVIYWDSIQTAKVGILACMRPDKRYKYVVDDGSWWEHAVKWDGTKEHLEKIRKGEI